MFIRDISLVPWGIMGLTNIAGGMGTMSQFRGGRRHGHRADHAPQWSTGQSWPVVVEMDGEGTPKWMVFVGKSQPQMDDLWVPTWIGNLHLLELQVVLGFIWLVYSFFLYIVTKFLGELRRFTRVDSSGAWLNGGQHFDLICEEFFEHFTVVL